MQRFIFAALAAVTLGGCASLGFDRAMIGDAGAETVQYEGCGVERLLDDGQCMPAERMRPIAFSATSYELDRRAFSLPTRRRPEQRPIFATSADYGLRVRRQWRRRYRKL